MINYLSEEEIIELNKYSLYATGEDNEFHVMQPDDVRFLINLVKKEFGYDLLQKALGYCISVIVLHPFKNGNHRTSLLSAERFLLKNNYNLLSSNKEKIEFEKWRLKYEEENDLEREFFQITNIENTSKKTDKIMKMMDSRYGKETINWLKKNYFKK